MAYDTLIDKAKEIAQRKSLADHIRAKGGTTAPMAWGKGFEDAVDAITKAKPEQEKTVNAIKNGPVVVTPDVGKVLSKATVNVNVPSDKKPEQTKTVDITSNGDVTITPDVGKVLSSVLAKVNVSGGGFDPAPFTKIEVKTWTPARPTDKYTVEDTPEQVVALEFVILPLGSVIGSDGLVKGSLFLGHLQSANPWDDPRGHITDGVYDLAVELEDKSGLFVDGMNYGNNCTFDRNTGVVDLSPKHIRFKGTYVVLIARGLLK